MSRDTLSDVGLLIGPLARNNVEILRNEMECMEEHQDSSTKIHGCKKPYDLGGKKRPRILAYISLKFLLFYYSIL